MNLLSYLFLMTFEWSMDFLFLRAALLLLRGENMRSRHAVYVLFVSGQFHSNFIKWRHYNSQKYGFRPHERINPVD